MKWRLSKFLADSGVASRRKCDELIKAKKVSVNGTVITTPYALVSKKDKIVVSGNSVQAEEKKLYFLLNKPLGFVCSHVRKNNEKLLYDLFSNVKERLFSVGRLDKDTSGLILVTNDGAFANRVIHPSQNIDKEYLVKTTSEITANHLKLVADGCYIDKRHVKPKRVKKVRKGTLRIVVQDGLKHEVRKLVDNAGLKLIDLARIRIGGLQMQTLPIGHYINLTKQQLDQIFQ